MHIFLTDRLTCPRCGPDFGLILLARTVQGRRVLEGDFGCANCREKYPVVRGFGDLRPPPRTEPLHAAPETGPEATETEAKGAGEAEESVQLAALLGVTQGPAMILIVGPAVRSAAALADLIPDGEVVAAGGSLQDDPEHNGVSRIAVGPAFPFYSGSFRGVVLDGSEPTPGVSDGARVLAPGGRLVVLDADDSTRRRVEGLGLRILLWENGVLVGQRKPG